MSDDGEVTAEQWIAALYRAHAPALLRYLTARVGTATAEDLTAETFLVVIRRRQTFDDARGSSRAWLFGIASNAVREHLRGERRYLRALARADGEPGEEQAHTEAVADRLDAEAAIARLVPHLLELSPVDRDILLLTSWAGLGPSEVAEALGLSAAAVRSRLHRTRRRLRATSAAAAGSPSESTVITALPRNGFEGVTHA